MHIILRTLLKAPFLNLDTFRELEWCLLLQQYNLGVKLRHSSGHNTLFLNLSLPLKILFHMPNFLQFNYQ